MVGRGEPAVRYVTRWNMHAALMWLKLTPGRGMMPAHGWIFSCLASIPMNCSIRRARVSAFFAV